MTDTEIQEIVEEISKKISNNETPEELNKNSIDEMLGWIVEKLSREQVTKVFLYWLITLFLKKP